MRRILSSLVASAALAAGALPFAAQHVVLDVHAIHAAKARPGAATANCSPDGSTSASEYKVIGWKVSGAQTTHFNTASVPSGLSASQVVTQLQNSYNAWGSKAPSISVATDGTTTSSGQRDGKWEVAFGRTSGSAIAVTYTWSSGGTVIESDTILNSKLPWFIGTGGGNGCESTPRYDVANIATHEFGHTYGLDHPNPGRYETMWAYGYTGETLKRTPGAGDVAGIGTIYP